MKTPPTPRAQFAELTVERCVIELARKLRGRAYKFTSPGRRAVPDRLVMIPREKLCPTCREGCAYFYIECKATGEKPTMAQRREHNILRRAGARVYVADCPTQVYAAFAAEGLSTPEGGRGGLDIV